MMINRNTPRWMIFLIDFTVVIFSFWLAYLLRFNFDIPAHEIEPIILIFPLFMLVRSLGFLVGKTYTGVLRYTSTQDTTRIFISNLAGSGLFGIINLITFLYFDQIFIIPFSIIILEFIISTFALSAVKVFVKVSYKEISKMKLLKSHMIIFGAGESGIIAKHALERDAATKYEIIAFLDDDQKKHSKSLEGVKIYPVSALGKIIKEKKVDDLIISVQNLKSERKKGIIEACLAFNINVMHVPPVGQWVNGQLSFKQIKNINITDLLGRDIIELDREKMSSELEGKVVLITGAAGSIGSELARQISHFNISKLYLVDQAETPLYNLELEMMEHLPSGKFEVTIADISQKARMTNVFNTYKPDIVYHAAAYKHVPMMEHNPSEAIRTNVMGTKNIADLSIEFGVEKFIMVSTDKAVNPTNVMGATKRMAEIYTQSLNQLNKTAFITTRFGNVLGSNGSVIPLFKKQIDNGGPITLTHPKVTRYFMTIPEACQLVLEAGAMGEGGEIFIFDMGESVKIIDLAKKMIRLSGLELGKDIQIKYVGLRPGEKLYEELLATEENTIPTHHPQILKAKVRVYNPETVASETQILIDYFEEQNNDKIVIKLKQMIPEFISQNSIFEQFNHKA
ncbi:MAG: polysaccharide biosynthesis protein [Bacteroidales bacterium]|nr:polysaccharide biosynthesis protein [Bacteroidales bacterium]